MHEVWGFIHYALLTHSETKVYVCVRACAVNHLCCRAFEILLVSSSQRQHKTGQTRRPFSPVVRYNSPSSFTTDK